MITTIHWLSVLFTFVGFIAFVGSVAYAWFGAHGYYGCHVQAAIIYGNGQLGIWNFKYLVLGIASLIVWVTL